MDTAAIWYLFLPGLRKYRQLFIYNFVDDFILIMHIEHVNYTCRFYIVGGSGFRHETTNLKSQYLYFIQKCPAQ